MCFLIHRHCGIARHHKHLIDIYLSRLCYINGNKLLRVSDPSMVKKYFSNKEENILIFKKKNKLYQEIIKKIY